MAFADSASYTSSVHLLEELGHPFGPPGAPLLATSPACVMHRYCLFCSILAFVCLDFDRLCLQVLSPVHLHFQSYSKGPLPAS